MIPDMVGRHLGSLRISQGVCKVKSYFQNKARQYLPLRTDRSKCRRTAFWGIYWTQGCGSLRHTARVLHLHTLAAKTNASIASFAWACPWERSKMHFISAHLVPWGPRLFHLSARYRMAGMHRAHVWWSSKGIRVCAGLGASSSAAFVIENHAHLKEKPTKSLGIWQILS